MCGSVQDTSILSISWELYPERGGKRMPAKFVKAGSWRTLESFWNASAVASFVHPSGAEIKVRYGYSWLGWDAQKKKLDGVNIKQLTVGGASVAYARMQIKVSTDTTVI